MTVLKTIVLEMPQILHWLATASIAALICSIVATGWYKGFGSFILVCVWIAVYLQFVQRTLPSLSDGAQVLGYVFIVSLTVRFTIRLWSPENELREAGKRARAIAAIKRIIG